MWLLELKIWNYDAGELFPPLDYPVHLSATQRRTSKRNRITPIFKSNAQVSLLTNSDGFGTSPTATVNGSTAERQGFAANTTTVQLPHTHSHLVSSRVECARQK
jgi:hypothetical protein